MANDCLCDEAAIWKLVIESETLKRITDAGESVVINNAYSYNNSRRAYWDLFICRFFELVIDPDGVDSLQQLYGKNLWNYGKEMVEKRNVRYPIYSQFVAAEYENVEFFNLDSLQQLSEIGSKNGIKFYPFEDTPTFCQGTSSITLDDNSHGAYMIGITLDSCNIVNEFYYWYPYYTAYCGVAASKVDWVDLIDFDMSLDSFYDYQYYEVLQKLDSLTLSRNSSANPELLYHNHPKFKGKW